MSLSSYKTGKGGSYTWTAKREKVSFQKNNNREKRFSLPSPPSGMARGQEGQNSPTKGTSLSTSELSLENNRGRETRNVTRKEAAKAF